MSETTYAKGACDLCGGHIEFPTEAAGRAIECPHCAGTTVLNLPVITAPRGKAVGRKWIALIAGCLVVAAVAVFIFKGRTSPKKPRDIDIKLISFERASFSNPGTVEGVVENRAEHPRQKVRVEIELLNARGEPLWSTTAFAPAIESKRSWTFRASVVDPNVVTARVSRVRELTP